MHRKIALLFAGVLTLLIPMVPANAITNGQPDGTDHPYVGQMLFFDPTYHDSRFKDPGGWFSCTGTLMDVAGQTDSDIVLSAGHCTSGVGDDGHDMWISFEEVPNFDILPPSVCFADNPDYTSTQAYQDALAAADCGSYGIANGNAARFSAWEGELDGDSTWNRGTAHPHPEYNDNAFYLHDAGVVVLDDALTMATYGELPSLGLIDQLYNENRQATYTPVGYGLEFSMPWGAAGGDNRRVATVKINDLNGVYGAGKGTSVGYSSNKGKPHTGGTCFGDSGGPTFPDKAGLTNTVITVTSFGIDGNCRAGGGGYRIDQTDDLDFLAGFGLFPPTS